jgi:hypothetical protein
VKKEACGNVAAHSSDSSSGQAEYNCAVLVSYCDSRGNYHHGVKMKQREQNTNGKKYTPTKKCVYPRCGKYTRVMCSTCNAPYCYPLLKKGEKRTEMSCFVKHVRNVRRREIEDDMQNNRKRKSNGRYKK